MLLPARSGQRNRRRYRCRLAGPRARRYFAFTRSKASRPRHNKSTAPTRSHRVDVSPRADLFQARKMSSAFTRREKGTCRRTQPKTLFRQVSTSSHRSTEQLTASRTEMRSNADFPPTENGISFAHPKSSVTRIPRPLVTESRRVVYDKVLFTFDDCCFVRVSVFRG